jgi:ribosome-binding ATPase YchF (GTP1/OBG family)
MELIYADMETLAKRSDRVRKMAQSGDAAARVEIALMDRISAALDAGLLPEA